MNITKTYLLGNKSVDLDNDCIVVEFCKTIYIDIWKKMLENRIRINMLSVKLN